MRYLAAGLIVLAGFVAVYTIWPIFTATQKFAFPALNGNEELVYRCDVLSSAQETLENASAANAFFEPLIFELPRMQAVAMAADMAPGRAAAEIIPDLENTIATAEKKQTDAKEDLRRRFGCSFLPNG